MYAARYAIDLQFDISANAFAIKALQSQKCIVWCAVGCTLVGFDSILKKTKKSKKIKLI
jgi:hypothetical protein